MKSTIKKLSALLLLLALVFSFAACGSGGETTTAAGTTANEETTTATGTTAAVETTAVETSAIVTTNDAATTAADQTTTKPAGITAPVGGSILNIVKFYNTYANATKAYKGTVEVTKESWFQLQPGDDQFIASVLNPLPGKGTLTFINGKSTDGSTTLKKFLPRGYSDQMSILEAAGVKEASCTESGTGWKVFIRLNSETVTGATALQYMPKYHSQCMDNIAEGCFGDFVVVDATVTYTDTTLTAIINADGLITELDIVQPLEIKDCIMKTKESKTELRISDCGITFSQDYRFTY